MRREVVGEPRARALELAASLAHDLERAQVLVVRLDDDDVRSGDRAPRRAPLGRQLLARARLRPQDDGHSVPLLLVALARRLAVGAQDDEGDQRQGSATGEQGFGADPWHADGEG
jgi:hypothetical protein